MKEANINSITRLRIHSDGEGVRSVVFMQGCPLDCFWCCNPETRFSESHRRLTTKQLYTYIREDVPYFLFSSGGLTFSGGEPLLWADFIRSFVQRYCSGFAVDVETSLYADWDVIEPLIPLINLWNVDFKVFHPSLHRAYTGQSNEKILDNLRKLACAAGPDRILVTYPVIPGCNDSRENLDSMIIFLQELGITKVEVHPYRKFSEEKHKTLNQPFREIPELSSKQYAEILALFRKNGIVPLERTSLYGKEKCEYLKRLRREICKKWELDVDIAECDITEGCIGTCPRCEQELREISLKHFL